MRSLASHAKNRMQGIEGVQKPRATPRMHPGYYSEFEGLDYNRMKEVLKNREYSEILEFPPLYEYMGVRGSEGDGLLHVATKTFVHKGKILDFALGERELDTLGGRLSVMMILLPGDARRQVINGYIDGGYVFADTVTDTKIERPDQVLKDNNINRYIATWWNEQPGNPKIDVWLNPVTNGVADSVESIVVDALAQTGSMVKELTKPKPLTPDQFREIQVVIPRYRQLLSQKHTLVEFNKLFGDAVFMLRTNTVDFAIWCQDHQIKHPAIQLLYDCIPAEHADDFRQNGLSGKYKHNRTHLDTVIGGKLLEKQPDFLTGDEEPKVAFDKVIFDMMKPLVQEVRTVFKGQLESTERQILHLKATYQI